MGTASYMTSRSASRPLAGMALCCLLLTSLLPHSANACTSFCMDTPDGPVFGSNLDLFIPGDGLAFMNQRGIAKESVRAGTTGERARWISRYGSVTFNPAGREFVWGGMNEAGLVLSSMELLASEHPAPDERPPLYIGEWAQYVLDTCGSVREVIRVDSLVRIEDTSPPSHYLIADAAGNCVAIEYLEGRFVFNTGENLPVKAMTNMRYDRALTARRQGGPAWWWSNPGQSAERFAAAADRNEAYDASRDASPVQYALQTLTDFVAAPHTKWSVVYDIPGREVWFRSAESPDVKHLSLKAFDLACDAPLLMMDINASVEGDVREAFKPYDHDTNLSSFRTFCERYGVEVSEEDATDLIGFFESFECAP